MWQRVAAFFSFLAIAGALLAPGSMLAEEVRTGKLSGLCAASTSAADAGIADILAENTHCDSCGSLAFTLPSFTAQGLCGKPDGRISQVRPAFGLAVLVAGLPPSRGPPLF